MERICRYGHGKLIRHESSRVTVDGGTERLLSAIPYVALPANPDHPAIPTEHIFTVSLYRCAECGYIELADEDGVTENG